MRRNLTLDVYLNAARLAMLAVCCNWWTAPVLAAKAKRADMQDGEDKMTRLTVRLYTDAGIPAGILGDAQKQTARILRAAGIELTVAPCPASDRDFQKTPAKFAACIQALDGPMVTIETQSNALSFPPLHGSVAGATKDDRVNIAYDRVRFICEVHNITPSKLLGSILAHELGHVLLGDNHSPFGIMIATFRKQELQHVETGDLFFSRSQATQMRVRLQGAGMRAGVLKGAAK
jgi:hypothetical protein